MNTDRLLFEKIAEQDFDNLVKLHTCPIVREYLGGALDPKYACEKTRALVQQSSSHFWVLKDKSRGFLGTIELDKHHDSDELEVSYLLAPDAWGQGFAKEALAAVINYTYQQLGRTKLLAETQAKNLRSIKLLQRSGFKEIRQLERFGAVQSLFEHDAQISSNSTYESEALKGD